MEIEKIFDDANEKMQFNQAEAKKDFEYILSILNNKHLKDIPSNMLRILAFSNMNLFLISQCHKTENAERAIEVFELFFENNKNDVAAYEAYILILELTYQYEKSKLVLMTLLQNGLTQETAWKFLSSYVYCAEGLQSIDDCIEYKKRLIDITIDPEEKNRLQGELKSMIKV